MVLAIVEGEVEELMAESSVEEKGLPFIVLVIPERFPAFRHLWRWRPRWGCKVGHGQSTP